MGTAGFVCLSLSTRLKAYVTYVGNVKVEVIVNHFDLNYPHNCDYNFAYLRVHFTTIFDFSVEDLSRSLRLWMIVHTVYFLCAHKLAIQR